MLFWRKKKKPKWEETWQEEVKNYILGFQRKAIEAKCFVVFDLETTGLNPEKDEILSFAFLKIEAEELNVEQRLEGFLQPALHDEIGAVEVHHVTKSDVQKGISEKAFVLQVLKFIHTATLVGHHVAFDIACVNRLLQKYFGIVLQNKSIDTAKLGARLAHSLPDAYGMGKQFKTLDELCEDYNIQPEARHSASGDAYTTALLFLKLLKHAKKRKMNL